MPKVHSSFRILASICLIPDDIAEVLSALHRELQRHTASLTCFCCIAAICTRCRTSASCPACMPCRMSHTAIRIKLDCQAFEQHMNRSVSDDAPHFIVATCRTTDRGLHRAEHALRHLLILRPQTHTTAAAGLPRCIVLFLLPSAAIRQRTHLHRFVRLLVSLTSLLFVLSGAEELSFCREKVRLSRVLQCYCRGGAAPFKTASRLSRSQQPLAILGCSACSGWQLPMFTG